MRITRRLFGHVTEFETLIALTQLALVVTTFLAWNNQAGTIAYIASLGISPVVMTAALCFGGVYSLVRRILPVREFILSALPLVIFLIFGILSNLSNPTSAKSPSIIYGLVIVLIAIHAWQGWDRD
jgi:hypothetical protein